MSTNIIEIFIKLKSFYTAKRKLLYKQEVQVGKIVSGTKNQ